VFAEILIEFRMMTLYIITLQDELYNIT